MSIPDISYLQNTDIIILRLHIKVTVRWGLGTTGDVGDPGVFGPLRGGYASLRTDFGDSGYLKKVWEMTKEAKTIETIDINLMRIFRLGPEVSLNGSPTVSPTTPALCAGEPFPP